jgi:hypothetical protein
VNLVGHVAVALEPAPAPERSTEFLVGCMLPDLAAIARVRIARPDGELGRGVAFHHACDSVFHGSEWFRSANTSLRDTLLAAGVDSGPARACSHAGVEMLLDGALIDDPRVLDAAARTLDAIDEHAGALAALVTPESRAVAEERFRRIGASLEPSHYRDPAFVAERLHAMTRGRRRIELPASQVSAVAHTLTAARPAVTDSSTSVLLDVRGAVSGYDRTFASPASCESP